MPEILYDSTKITSGDLKNNRPERGGYIDMAIQVGYKDALIGIHTMDTTKPTETANYTQDNTRQL
jgi:hypothetical protein